MNSPYTIIPVIFSGTGEELDDFVNRYDIKTITSQKIGASIITEYILKANMTRQDFESNQ
jgi:hypothetical protein